MLMEYVFFNKFHDTANPQGMLSDSQLGCILKSPGDFKASPNYSDMQPELRIPDEVKC